MSLLTYDWVIETTTTTSTGTLTLAGAVSGYRAFSVVGTGRPCKYAVYDVDANGNFLAGGNWEVGQGTYTLSGTTLSRDVVIASSNAGALVNFTAGTKRVELVAPSNVANETGLFFYGDGSDGDVTIASGTTTLTRDMYYRNLTLSGTGVLKPNGWRVFVSETFDVSAAPAGAIVNNGVAASNAVGVTGGTGVAGVASATVGDGGTGANGATGSSGAGGAGATATTITANGGAGGAAGAGGTGAGGAGGAGGLTPTVTAMPVRKYQDFLTYGTALIQGGGGGSGGGAGGGNGAGTGNGGAAGAGGAGCVFISARTIKRGGSTAAAAIQAKGGNGAGNASTNTNCGGGGGSGGSGGGWLYICFGGLAGSTATNMLDASGGTGGTAGNGNGSGTGGSGGSGGSGGRITLINLGAGTITETTGSAGSAGSGPTGTTGGAGGAGNTLQASL